MFGTHKQVIIVFKKDIQFTQNLFGTIDELKLSPVLLMEKNDIGDCLCMVNNKYLVSIDHRDIIRVAEIPTKIEMVGEMMKSSMFESLGRLSFDDCNDCPFINMNEQEQERLKKEDSGKNIPDHRCKLSKQRLIHKGQHPRLPRPDDCPLPKTLV